ncbi:MAG: YggS family pyridoxal phosphate-dependent enzyme [Moraxellaceae bacterium]
MTDFIQQRQQILTQITAVCTQAGRAPDAVQLLAVSKTQPAESIRQLFSTGQSAFGENYLQEALAKQAELADLPIEWHFIGQIQRNKTRDLAAHFAWVHGVDRLVLAERLSSQRALEQPALNICLQVNIDDEDSKAGCTPAELPELVAAISRLPQLRLRGLMVIPAKQNTDAFAQTARLFADARAGHAQPADWDTLSMGMSADLAEAIMAGATIVRIGTALFGARQPVRH